MSRFVFLLTLLMAARYAQSQKVESIHFNLYTDSLKKGFYNYINVDGKTADGNWLPLTAEEIEFSVGATDSTLFFKNNDLFIDSTYAKPTVTLKAVLRSNPKIWKEITIYIRKRGFDEPLKTNDEIMEEYTKQPARKKKNSKQ